MRDRGAGVRSLLPSYDLRPVESLDAALRIMSAPPGVWKPFAGGTDLMVLLEAGTLPHTRFVSIWGLPELRGIVEDDGRIAMGGATTYSEVLASPVLSRDYPLLCAAAGEIGGVATQNRGTIAGNIANASPAADTPPALLVYDAEIEVASIRGRRILSYSTFHTGYKQMNLAPDELIVAIRLARPAWTHQVYRKVGTRRAQAISKVCFAAGMRLEQGTIVDARLAFGSVAPTCIRAAGAEQSLRGQPLDVATIARAATALVDDIAPIDDMRSTAAYRRRVAGNLLTEFLTSVMNER